MADQSDYHGERSGAPFAWFNEDTQRIAETFGTWVLAELERALAEAKECGNSSDAFTVAAHTMALMLDRMVDDLQERTRFIQKVRRDADQSGLPVEACLGIFLQDVMSRFWLKRALDAAKGGDGRPNDPAAPIVH